MPFITALIAGLGLAFSGVEFGLSEANQPGTPSTKPTPLTPQQNQTAVSQAASAAQQLKTQGISSPYDAAQQILNNNFSGNPQYWGDAVQGAAQTYGGGALTAGPQPVANTPGLTGGTSILDFLSASKPQSGQQGPGGAGAGGDMISKLIASLNSDSFHGFSG